MDGSSEARCLGCGRKFKVPSTLMKMAEYFNGQPLLFCKRACNLDFVSRLGRAGQEKQMQELISRLEGSK